MRRDGLLTVIAGVLLTAGLLLGFVPVHSSNGEDCGSPFASNVDSLRRVGDLEKGFLGLAGVHVDSISPTDAAAECDSKLNSTRPIAILLIALGGAGLVGALFSYVASEARKQPLLPASGNEGSDRSSEMGTTQVESATAEGVGQVLSAQREALETRNDGGGTATNGGLAVFVIALVVVVVIVLAAASSHT